MLVEYKFEGYEKCTLEVVGENYPEIPNFSEVIQQVGEDFFKNFEGWKCGWPIRVAISIVEYNRKWSGEISMENERRYKVCQQKKITNHPAIVAPSQSSIKQENC